MSPGPTPSSRAALTLAPREVDQAAALLRDGRLVVMPTETVYGLAADATRPSAVQAVFHAKGRPADDPLIVHVSPGLLGEGGVAEGLIRLGLVAPDAARDRIDLLAAAFWPGPLTLLLPRGPAVSDAVTAGLPAVAVRMPAHPVALALIDAAGCPLVAPSANRFGAISPTTAAAALAELDGRVDAVLDGGPCGIGVESTVLDPGPPPRILRPGAVGPADLAPLIGAVDAGRSPVERASPGLLDRHYAPRTPMTLAPRPANWTDDTTHALAALLAPPGASPSATVPAARLGWLGWSAADGVPEAVRAQLTVADALSADGDPIQAARALYTHLRALDEAGLDHLLVALPPPAEVGAAPSLTVALADRLRRAAGSRPPLPGG